MGNNVHGNLKRKRKKSSQDSEDLREVAASVPDSIMDFYDKRDEIDEQMKEEDFLGEKSPIEEYYTGKNILITGASGFVGTILLEKLLRTQDIGKIYLLFRGKRSQSLDSRLKEYFEDEVFYRLYNEKPHYYRRIVVLQADMQLDGLGLKKHERKVLMEDIQIIFHVAATVKFDEPLNIAYDINCKGTEILLNMAEQMRKLESFVYVSTAYSNCHVKEIEEKFYDPFYTCQEIKQIVDSCSDSELRVLNDTIIKPMPNTYTLTKQAIEGMFRERLHKLPLVIVRPSIIMPVVKEPCPMWLKGMNGLTAMYVAVGTGVMRTVYQSTDNIIDIVPGDTVINMLLAAGWDKAMQHMKMHRVTRRNVQRNEENTNTTPEKYIDNDGHNENFHFKNERCKSSHNVKVVKSEKFRNEHNLHDIEDSSNDIKSKNGCYNSILHVVSCVENPIKLGESTNMCIEYNKESKEGYRECLWVVHHNPTNNKWLYFFYFYVYNILPTILFFVFLEKLAGKKAQLMKIYRKIFFLNNTIANFSINEWTFTNSNALALYNRMSRRDKQKYNFSMKNLRWSDYHLHLHRSLVRYCLGSFTSRESYDTRLKYMHIVDCVAVNAVKIFLVYLAFYVFCGY